LLYDSHELNLGAGWLSFWILFWNFLVSFIVTSLPFPSYYKLKNTLCT